MSKRRRISSHLINIILHSIDIKLTLKIWRAQNTIIRQSIFRLGMTAKNSNKFYAVAKGRQTGVFHNWAQCREQVHKFTGAVFKSFPTLHEAQLFAGTSDLSSLHYRPQSAVGIVKKRKLDNHSQVLDFTDDLAKADQSAPNKTIGPSKNVVEALSPLPFSVLRPFNEANPLNSDNNQFTAEPSSISVSAIDQTGDNLTIVYTDGSCLGNGKRRAKGGIGVYFGKNDPRFYTINPRNISEPLPKVDGYLATNNRAELTAVIRALLATPMHDRTLVYTDSQYTISGLTNWMPGWKRKGWKKSNGDSVLNEDLWKTLDLLYSARTRTEIKYCKAHVGIEGNEMADLLANQGADKYINHS